MRTHDELRTLVAALAGSIGGEPPVSEQDALNLFNLFCSGDFAGGLVEREWRLANADRIIAEARRGWVPVELAEEIFEDGEFQGEHEDYSNMVFRCTKCDELSPNILTQPTHKPDCIKLQWLAAIEAAKEGKS